MSAMAYSVVSAAPISFHSSSRLYKHVIYRLQIRVKFNGATPVLDFGATYATLRYPFGMQSSLIQSSSPGSRYFERMFQG
jgi:hypothetical protein